MRSRWQKITFWLIAEITLNLVGLDDLADYSEFTFEQQVVLIRHDIAEINLIFPLALLGDLGLISLEELN